MSGSTKGDHSMGPIALTIVEEVLALLARGSMAACRAAHAKLQALHAASKDPKGDAAHSTEAKPKWDLPHATTSAKG